MYYPKDNHRYDDIIRMPHHTSTVHPRMPVTDRAAQFSPFAALTGYEDAIREKARLTESRMELDEYEKAELDEQLKRIQEHLTESPEVTITYFQPDVRKDGGAYLTVTGCIKKIDQYERLLILRNGEKIPMDEILGMACAELIPGIE